MNARLMQLMLGTAMSAAMLFLLSRIIDTRAVVSAIELADPRLIIVAIGIYFLAMCIRSVVWRRLLPAADSTLTLLRITVIGFAVNYLMPLRVGEFARAYLAVRWCRIDYGTTFASLVAERVLDGLAVGLILMAALLLIPVPGYVLVLGLAVAVVFTTLATALIVASWRPDGLISATSWITSRLPVGIRSRVMRLATNFTRGLAPLQDWRGLPPLAALAILGWLLQFSVFYLLMLAFPMAGSLPAALVDGGVANFATLLPSAPGYVGTFDAALIKLLMDLQGVPVEFATAYALVVHAVLVVPIVVLAVVILWRSDLTLAHVLGRTIPLKRGLSGVDG